MLAWRNPEERKAGAPHRPLLKGPRPAPSWSRQSSQQRAKSRRGLRLAPRPPHGAGRRDQKRGAGGPEPREELEARAGSKGQDWPAGSSGPSTWGPGVSETRQGLPSGPEGSRTARASQSCRVRDTTPTRGAAVGLSVNLREDDGDLLTVRQRGAAGLERRSGWEVRTRRPRGAQAGAARGGGQPWLGCVRRQERQAARPALRFPAPGPGGPGRRQHSDGGLAQGGFYRRRGPRQRRLRRGRLRAEGASPGVAAGAAGAGNGSQLGLPRRREAGRPQPGRQQGLRRGGAVPLPVAASCGI